MKDKILITGARGFIGNAVTKRLSALNIKYITIEGDIRSDATLRKINGEEIKCCIHLAGKTFVPESWEKPKDYYDINANGTLNVLEYCRIYSIKLIFISSYIYGEPEYLPIDEKHRICISNPYMLSKYIAEELCEFYADKFNVKCTILRLFNVFGKGQDKNFLIPSIIQQAISSDKIEVFDLNPRRDYVYIDDVVQAIICAVKFDGKFERFNIGCGKSYSVREVIAYIQEILCICKEVQCKETIRENEIKDTIANYDKAKKMLGWVPKIDLYEGLRKMLEV